MNKLKKEKANVIQVAKVGSVCGYEIEATLGPIILKLQICQKMKGILVKAI